MTDVGTSQAVDPRVREWESVPAEQLRRAVRCLVWGEPDLFLSADDLVECVSGKHGRVVANRFASVFSRGVRIDPDGDPNELRLSFLHSCVFRGHLDLLDRLFCVPESALRELFALDKHGWMKHLATIDGDTRIKPSWSLFFLAEYGSEPKRVLELAVNHFPDHPDIAAAIERGGPEAATLAELVMNRHVEAASAQEQAFVIPPASVRRRQGV